jgi:hypothetical protein
MVKQIKTKGEREWKKLELIMKASKTHTEFMKEFGLFKTGRKK